MRKKKQKQASLNEKKTESGLRRIKFNLSLTLAVSGFLFCSAGFFFTLSGKEYILPVFLIVIGYTLIAFSIPVNPPENQEKQ